MKEVIKLILIYFMIAQGLAPLLALIPCVLYQWITIGTLDKPALFSLTTIPGLFITQLLTLVYLWLSGYLQPIIHQSQPFAVRFKQQLPLLPTCLIAMLAASILSMVLSDLLKGLPNILEQTFQLLQSDWGGIFIIALIGPLFEEIFFRGVLTRLLLQSYRPIYALLLSGAIFGICHINPAQIIPAFLIGTFWAWVYYRTNSLLPGMLMHIVNNSLSVYLNIHFPTVKHLDELIHGGAYLLTCGVACFLFAISLWIIQRQTTRRQPFQ